MDAYGISSKDEAFRSEAACVVDAMVSRIDQKLNIRFQEKGVRADHWNGSAFTLYS